MKSMITNTTELDLVSKCSASVRDLNWLEQLENIFDWQFHT